jgi:hypothetical protein
MDHSHHHHHHSHQHHTEVKVENRFSLAISATLHCLLGCGIGEVLGLIIANIIGLDMISSMVLAVSLGFVAGFALGIYPLLRAGFGFKQALKMVFVAEGLSIVVMETFEVLTQIYVPGVMEAGLTSFIFWFGMLLSLLVGFIAALPVNYYLIGIGVRHHH